MIVLVRNPTRMRMSILTSELFLFFSLIAILIDFLVRFGKIYLCGAFWNAPMTGTDSKVNHYHLNINVYELIPVAFTGRNSRP